MGMVRQIGAWTNEVVGIEIRMFHNPIPGLQSRRAIRVLLRELQQASPGNYVHTQCVSHFEILSSSQKDQFGRVFVLTEKTRKTMLRDEKADYCSPT